METEKAAETETKNRWTGEEKARIVRRYLKDGPFSRESLLIKLHNNETEPGVGPNLFLKVFGKLPISFIGNDDECVDVRIAHTIPTLIDAKAKTLPAKTGSP